MSLGKFVCVLLLTCSSVQAGTVATAENRSGGTTVLTDVPCKNEKGLYVYSQSPRSPTLFGCWWSDDAMVHITWQDGEFRSYPLHIFNINYENVEKLRKRERPTY